MASCPPSVVEHPEVELARLRTSMPSLARCRRPGKSPTTTRNYDAIISTAPYQAARWGWVKTKAPSLYSSPPSHAGLPDVVAPHRAVLATWLTGRMAIRRFNDPPAPREPRLIRWIQNAALPAEYPQGRLS